MVISCNLLGILGLVHICLAVSQPPCDEFVEFKHSVENEDWECLRCTKCPIGSGTLIECSGYNDTLCVTCKEGETFSYDYGESRDCLPCSSCDENGVIMKICDLYNDVQCGDCKEGYRFDIDQGICVRNTTADTTGVLNTAAQAPQMPAITQPAPNIAGAENRSVQSTATYKWSINDFSQAQLLHALLGLLSLNTCLLLFVSVITFYKKCKKRGLSKEIIIEKGTV